MQKLFSFNAATLTEKVKRGFRHGDMFKTKMGRLLDKTRRLELQAYAAEKGGCYFRAGATLVDAAKLYTEAAALGKKHQQERKGDASLLLVLAYSYFMEELQSGRETPELHTAMSECARLQGKDKPAEEHREAARELTYSLKDYPLNREAVGSCNISRLELRLIEGFFDGASQNLQLEMAKMILDYLDTPDFGAQGKWWIKLRLTCLLDHFAGNETIAGKARAIWKKQGLDNII